MGRNLESNEILPMALSVVVPGLGHLLTGRALLGLLFLASAGVCVFLGLDNKAFFGGYVVVGIVAAISLYLSITGGEVEDEELPAPPPRPRSKPANAAQAADTGPHDQLAEPSEEAAAPAVDVKPSVDIETTKPMSEPAKEALKEASAASEAEEEPPPALDPPAAADFSGEDYPIDLDPEDRQLYRLSNAMTFAEQWHEDHGQWENLEADVADDAPELLKRIIAETGAVRFPARWSWGWPFDASDTVVLFDRVAISGTGYVFGRIESRDIDLLWRPDGSIALRDASGKETDHAEDLDAFVDELVQGFRVARDCISTSAMMGNEDLVVLPESERELKPEDSQAGFPSFWFGARGPGMDDVGFSFEAPLIRHSRGSRVVEPADIATIVAFLEWLDSDPESTEGALAIANDADHARPVGVVVRDGNPVVAWWGESPPEEVDAFLDHLRGLTYWG